MGINNQMFTEIDHAPWQTHHYELTDNSNKILQKYHIAVQIYFKSLFKKFKKKQREKKALLTNCEESLENPKQMATDGLDSGLGLGFVTSFCECKLPYFFPHVVF